MEDTCGSIEIPWLGKHWSLTHSSGKSVEVYNAEREADNKEWTCSDASKDSTRNVISGNSCYTLAKILAICLALVLDI